jgi:asparaginyl-tRNA synthetase
MLEAEWAFIQQGDDVREVCRFVEAMLRNVVGPLVTTNSDLDMECLWKGNPNAGNLESLQKTFGQKDWWTCMTYTEAVKELEGAGVEFEYTPKWGKALQSEHERWLAETLVKGPVFVTDYPVGLKPFYMRLNDDGKTVACFDLLVPHIGELVGGSVREERIDILRENMTKAGLVDGGAYQWYEDLRKYGGAPHAGFGMGFERLVGWVGGIENIRECVPMPRWAGRLLL